MAPTTPNTIPIIAPIDRAVSDDVGGREVVAWDEKLVLEGREEVVSVERVIGVDIADDEVVVITSI